MKRAALMVAAALAAGCSAQVQLSGGSGAGPPASGTSVTTGPAGLQVESNTLTALVLTGMFFAAALEGARDPRPFPSMSVFSDWMRSTPPPPLAPDRPVNEQDCSKPIVETGGNLRCR